MTNESERWAWENARRKPPDSALESTEQVLEFLRNNGHDITTDTIQEVQWAIDDQICANNPEKCRGRPPRSASALIAAPSRMTWAPAFWQAWNVLAADEHDDPGALAVAQVLVASALVNGAQGCEHCAEHWGALLAQSPIDRISTNDDHRAWLWAAHNQTREGKSPVPFAEIARRWKWPPLEDVVITATLTRLGFANE